MAGAGFGASARGASLFAFGLAADGVLAVVEAAFVVAGLAVDFAGVAPGFCAAAAADLSAVGFAAPDAAVVFGGAEVAGLAVVARGGGGRDLARSCGQENRRFGRKAQASPSTQKGG